MSEVEKTLSEEIAKELNTLKKSVSDGVEKINEETKGVREKIESCATKSELEEINEKHVASLAKMVETNQKNQEVIKNLEEKQRSIELALSSKGGVGALETKTRKQIYNCDFVKNALPELLVRGIMPSQEVLAKSYNSEVAGDGALFLPTIMETEITKQILEVTDFRADCKITNIAGRDGNLVEVPKLESRPTGYWVGQREDIPQSQARYGEDKIRAYDMGVSTSITRQLINDMPSMDFEAEFMTDVMEVFGELEDDAILNGDGVAKPSGIFNNGDVQVIPTGTAGDFTFDDIINIIGQLKAGYSRNAKMYFSRSMWIKIFSKKDEQGQYLINPNLAMSPEPNLYGIPYKISQQMPSFAAEAKSLMLADLSRGYKIVDKEGVGIMRDPYTKSQRGETNVHVWKRMGGDVILPEAIKLLEIAPSA